jgi:hypothetical protein
MEQEIESRIAATLDYLGAIGKGAVETELPALAQEVVTFGIFQSGMTLGACMFGLVAVLLVFSLVFRYLRKLKVQDPNSEAGIGMALAGLAAAFIVFFCVVEGTEAAIDLAKATLTPRVYLWEWVSRQVK